MKQFSSKKSVQILAHLLNEYSVNHFVLSPGSRNAPLAVHFSETDNFNCYSIVDERSAAFVALGMAVAIGNPVVISCTSGSAAANYYPAITEAFYQNIPLLILTADRPSDYVDLFDGQTIRQNNLFNQHSYGDFELLEDDVEGSEDYNWETIKKAIELCFEKRGPVHINIPLSEPLYNLVSEIPIFPSIEKSIRTAKYTLPSNLIADWNLSKRILILVGTRPFNDELQMILSQLVKNHSVVVLTEVNSNLNNEKFFEHIDRYVYNFNEEDFSNYAPDLLITIGQNVVSKKVKQFLRKAKPKQHWHIDEYWQPDTYFSLTEEIRVSPEVFFRQLIQQITLEPRAYYNLWSVLRDKKDEIHNQYVKEVPFSDFYFFKHISDVIPENYHIHFSNSSAIRYAQLFRFNKYRVHCNRGTSGIDGCTSTAMGYAMLSSFPTLLITGDISFFYDINGLWNQYIPPYTRIVLFNNGGGDIFKIIPGPSNASNSIDEFISTQHQKNAQLISKHFGFEYIGVDNEEDLERVLSGFFNSSDQPKLLEVNTRDIDNSEMLKEYFNSLQ